MLAAAIVRNVRRDLVNFIFMIELVQIRKKSNSRGGVVPDPFYRISYANLCDMQDPLVSSLTSMGMDDAFQNLAYGGKCAFYSYLSVYAV